MEIKRHFGAKAKEKEAKDDFGFRNQRGVSIDTLLVSIDTSFGPAKSKTLSSLEKRNLPQKTSVFALLVLGRFIGFIYIV